MSLGGAVLYYRNVRLGNISCKLLNYNHVFRQFSSGCSDRLRDLRLGLTTNWPAENNTDLINFDKQCAVLNGIQAQPRVDITCEDGATGRYLVIQIARVNHSLSMCEVEVFEKVSGK